MKPKDDRSWFGYFLATLGAVCAIFDLGAAVIVFERTRVPWPDMGVSSQVIVAFCAVSFLCDALLIGAMYLRSFRAEPANAVFGALRLVWATCAAVLAAKVWPHVGFGSPWMYLGLLANGLVLNVSVAIFHLRMLVMGRERRLAFFNGIRGG